MKMIYSHELAAKAFGWQTENGRPCTKDTHCMLSGAPLRKGDPALRWKLPAGFTDNASLAYRAEGEGWIAPACAMLLEKDTMVRLQNAAFTADRSFVLTKGVYRKHFLLNPPEPPFVVGISDTKLAHIVWRTPVTLDKDFWHVRLGQRLFTLRRSMALEADAACDAIVARWALGKSLKAYIPSHPFVSLDASGAQTGNLSNLGLARIKADFEEFIEPAEHSLFCRMGLGEFWALALMRGTGGNLEAPPPISF